MNKRPTEGLYWINGSYIAHTNDWPHTRGREVQFSDEHPYLIHNGKIEIGDDPAPIPVSWVTEKTTFHGPHIAPWKGKRE